MNTECNESRTVIDHTYGDDRAQIWIIGTRDQVIHQMNEFYVRNLVPDRARFTPIIPAPFAKGKYMTVLER
ncbi:hypothetical protein [Leptolyngbya sp. 7M]|uniref:hypothetical protein n=1 Tax=Leptolyngbya sp. 7M TaxID=2812896 RepID=UPI001B8ADFB5|nr:hypothetical protein [Leptolyngbya sp. 7M]QYO62274.1 hypothetical protein JVX88_19455 [Leptolyngbya sp. 7M]